MTTTKASCWSVTINNPSDADEEDISTARQKGWIVDGQLEKGDSGTPHYQLIVRTGQVRFSAVKKQFPRAHIEVARNPSALQQYVHKDETREGALKTDQKYYPSLASTWILWYVWVEDNYKPEEWMNWDNLQAEKSWNKFVSAAIEDGYHIEGIAVNPSTICCIRRFGMNILFRASKEYTDKTDSQTQENGLESSQNGEV